ncbi:MAG: ArnT family glycosyltransferase, partial [Luteibaculum sp.]
LCFIFYRAGHNKKTRLAALSGFFIGLAVLTKGPVGLLIFSLCVGFYLLFDAFRKFPKPKHIVAFVLALLLVIFSWWSFDIAENGFKVVGDFIDYQIRLFSTPDAGHKQPWFYHFLVVFIGCFPLSIFAIRGFFIKDSFGSLHFSKWMKILFWVVMVLFTIVTTKIVHYSSMAYLPLSFIASLNLYKQDALKRWEKFLYSFFALLWSVFFIAAPIVLPDKEIMASLLEKDAFAKASFLQEVQWTGSEWIGGAVFAAFLGIAVYLIFKNKNKEAIIFHALGQSILFVWLGYQVLPKVEQYVQGPAIAFFKEAQDKDVYLNVAGFKSYGRAFYSKVEPIDEANKLNNQWLVNSPEVDKEVWIVTKVTNREYDDHTNLILKEKRGGFKLFVRPLNKTQ